MRSATSNKITDHLVTRKEGAAFGEAVIIVYTVKISLPPPKILEDIM